MRWEEMGGRFDGFALGLDPCVMIMCLLLFFNNYFSSL